MKLTLFVALLITASNAIAWQGYDYDKGTYVEIEKGNLVRPGRDIEVYDYQRGYVDVEVESIRRVGRTVEVEVRDRNTGETRTLEMED